MYKRISSWLENSIWWISLWYFCIVPIHQSFSRTQPKILKDLLDSEEIEKLYLEFDDRKTKEAVFAHFCDKLECDLQCRLYDEEECVDLNNQEGNDTVNDPTVRKYLNTGKSWSEMWLEFGQERYNYDENFKSVSEYAKNNKIKLP